MIGIGQDALAVTQQRPRQTPLLFERDTFRRQRDALDEAEPSENPRHMQRLQPLVHCQRIGQVSGMRKQPGVADGERYLEQRGRVAEPVGTASAMREIGAELAGEISAGKHAQVDLIAEFSEDARRRVAHSIPARFVNARPNSDVLLDTAAQQQQLLALEFAWQVTGVGVLIGLPLDKRRIIPWLQVSTNFTGMRTMQIADNLVGLFCGTHRVVENIGRSDLIPLEDPLHLQLRFDRRHTHCPTRLLPRPVEFGLRIDHDDDHRRLVGRPVDHAPCFRVEHASAGASNGLCLRPRAR